MAQQLSDTKIEDTAFVCAEYRARDVALSGDPFAHLWPTAKTKEWVGSYLAEVSGEEAFVHCLRNRFWLEEIGNFLNRFPEACFVNFGCGFSLYPFVSEDRHTFVEVDVKDVIEFKRAKSEQLIKEGKLPARKIEWVVSDFEDQDSYDNLRQRLISRISGRPSFFLIEGVLFYLSKDAASSLFSMFKELQKLGDRVGSVSFLPEIRATEVYQRFLSYFERRLGITRDNYLELPLEFYQGLSGYRLLKHTEYCELSRKYSPDRSIDDPDDILNEHMFLLERDS